ncbi:MAG: hypothetical protein H0T66_01460 [Geodermatophilaceae bacterium]|nr:hypothetical protein [Geodermatophilaceae bacterium]
MGEEPCDVIVCTPGWLARSVTRDSPVMGRYHLIVESMDWPRILEYLARRWKQWKIRRGPNSQRGWAESACGSSRTIGPDPKKIAVTCLRPVSRGCGSGGAVPARNRDYWMGLWPSSDRIRIR